MSEPGEIEEVDAVPVLAPAAVAHERSRALVRPLAPTVQAAAVAVGGFVAGAAVVGLASRRRSDVRALTGRRARRAAVRRRAPTSGRAGELVQIVATRSLLVDVHLLDRPGRGR